MAYADFSLNRSQSGLQVASSGISVLNSGLANPLTGTGDYCRGFAHTHYSNSSSTSRSYARATVDSGVLSGSLVDPSYTVATSLRAYVRVAMPSLPTRGYDASDPFTGRVWAGLGSFTQESASSGGGWSLELQSNVVDNATAEVSLVLRGGTGGGVDDIASESFNKIQTVESGLSLDSWYLIRLDTIPRGENHKTIKCYRSTDGGTTWTLLHTREVNFLDADWAPSNSLYGHFGLTTGATAVNGTTSADPVHFVGYFDSFTASTETLS